VDLQLTEKIVVITGASSGIGRATALTVAAEGGIPILVARSTDKLEKAKAKAEIEGAGGTAYVCTADVTDSAAPDRVIATVLEQYGRMAARLLTRRLGRAEDLANVIAYLVSPLSHQVTAAEWSVDGGIQRQV
jgi:NAD(P)-dependent dehydrogenase (short-subunit alcohol dehydrogenase family)